MERLCVNLIGPYVLKGKDGSEVNLMYFSMMDQATNWFEIVELPVVEKPGSKISDMNVSTELLTKHLFKLQDLSKNQGFVGTLVANTLFMTTAENLSCTSVS